MMEKIQSQKVVSTGGLNSNVNHLYLSDYEPGSAISLLNFEASLFGGYRRLTGYAELNEAAPEVDPDNAEGKVLTVAIFGADFMAARKQQSGDTYEFYYNDGTSWTPYTTGLTRSSVGVNRIRHVKFNFNGTEKILFVDGVNPACIYDGTTWTEIEVANTGADYANAGGDQTIDNPEFVTVFKNHIFFSKGNLVVHSAPLAEFDWTVASGAGQIPVGFDTVQIRPFRDTLFVFGTTDIKSVTVSSTDFVLNDVTSDIGCLASDSVIEINGNLLFLSQDGMRPIAGTDKVDDIEISSISRKIQSTLANLISNSDMTQVISVLIRGKSQFRTFFSSDAVSRQETQGIIGCIRSLSGETSWEWGRLKGIRVSCATSEYIGTTEYIIHGDYDGRVYRQETGNSFAGDNVTAIYSTPYFDFGDAGVRKTMRKIILFARPEGNMLINYNVTFDWDDPYRINPFSYAVANQNQNQFSFYGTASEEKKVLN